MARIELPAAGSKPVQMHSEPECESRSHDEARQSEGEYGYARCQMIDRATPPECGGDAEWDAREERDEERGEPERRTHRQALSDELGYLHVPDGQRGAEPPVEQAPEIVYVLSSKRPIEPVRGLHDGPDRRRQRLRRLEGASGREANREKRRRDDQEKDRHDRSRTAQSVGDHERVSIPPDMRG